METSEMMKRLVVLQKITQPTEEEKKELARLITAISIRSSSTIRYKRESGDKEEKEEKYFIIDDVGVIDFDYSILFFFLNKWRRE